MNISSHRLLPLVLLAACVLRRPGDVADSEGDGTSSAVGGWTAATSSSSEPEVSGPGLTTAGELTTGPGSSATTSGVDASTSGGETTGSFIVIPDGGGCVKECDPWVQDCPSGQKCMPYSGDGDFSWESLKCVEVVSEPDGLYEQCTVVGSGVSGEDSCDVGMICWDVVDGVGGCVGQCTGSPDAPGCVDPLASCHVAGDGVLTLCLPMCSPLLQDCPGGDDCVPNPQDSSRFLCVFEGEEQGQVFDPCQFVDECAKGLFCQSPGSAVECDLQASGCCLPFCDTSLANACPGQGQECLPWYEDGEAPPGFENVGTCGLP
ncbi:hypothetical protein [Nannocystis pusilla]|uniref:Lipoprotein n=1 Tax=Nannocystis pusilla TaxID=889268 RepID=A0ABS7TJJ2_9BACT|nr:hypothetical protein [Nannocystis pusilla]MBZ5708371.1 hypothetical protein [Nannocystis pusilla]